MCHVSALLSDSPCWPHLAPGIIPVHVTDRAPAFNQARNVVASNLIVIFSVPIPDSPFSPLTFRDRSGLGIIHWNIRSELICVLIRPNLTFWSWVKHGSKRVLKIHILLYWITTCTEWIELLVEEGSVFM